MMSIMSADATNLDSQVTDLLAKIRNKEGLEVLSAIKDNIV